MMKTLRKKIRSIRATYNTEVELKLQLKVLRKVIEKVVEKNKSVLVLCCPTVLRSQQKL